MIDNSSSTEFCLFWYGVHLRMINGRTDKDAKRAAAQALAEIGNGTKQYHRIMNIRSFTSQSDSELLEI